MKIDPNKHYYVEPVEIEVYLKKAGKVRTVIKDLHVELIPVEPVEREKQGDIRHLHREGRADRPDGSAELTSRSSSRSFTIPTTRTWTCSKSSRCISSPACPGASTRGGMCLYFTELLMKYEPTVASKAIGDFQTHNLNYLIIRLNAIGEPFLLEDSTVAYLIKRKNMATRHLPRDKEFDKLVELWEYNVKEKFF